MRTSYNYNARTVWKVSIQYLWKYQFPVIAFGLSFLVIGICQYLTNKRDFFFYLGFAYLPMWLASWLFGTWKRGRATRALKDDAVQLEIDENGISTETMHSKIRREWEIFDEAFFLKDYAILREKGTATQMLLPLVDGQLRNIIISHNLKMARPRPIVPILLLSAFLVGLFALPVLTNTPVNKESWSIAEQIRNRVRCKMGLNVGIYVAPKKVMSDTGLRDITVTVHSDSVAFLPDTLQTELNIIRLLDSVPNLKYGPVTFEYVHQMNRFSSRSISRTYSIDKLELIRQKNLPNQSLKHDAGRRLLFARVHPLRSVSRATGRARLCGSVDAVWAICGRTAQFS